MRILLLSLTFVFAAELEVEGDLKVTGSVDANGNPITNVGEPVVSSDVATANYVLERTAGKGRIIVLKCPWAVHNGGSSTPAISSCTPPDCPDGWLSLTTYNEVVSVASDGWRYTAGNSIRYCIEQEDEE